MSEFYRKVHLDGHLSPLLDEIGGAFDKKDFQQKLIDSNTAAITLFAKCHHGYTYYPSQVGEMNPALKISLLDEQVAAAREIGVKANIYITVGWSVRDFELHPEWCAYDFDTKAVKNNHYNLAADKDEKVPDGSWINLCPTGDYLEEIKALTAEVCERYKPIDGLFYDICFNGTACVCPSCVAGMKKSGLDPEKRADAELYFKRTRLKMMGDLNKIIKQSNPAATIFYNGSAFLSASGIDYSDYHPFDTHYEIEELPTLEGNYDKGCIKAKYFEGLKKPIMGMTGKFHLGWGEFGGLKAAEALVYEAANALSLGMGFCVGDQIHPSGKLDGQTYKVIGEAFKYIKDREELCLNSQSVGDLGIVLCQSDSANEGVNAMLIEMQIDYTLVDENTDFSMLKCVIMPGKSNLSLKLKEKLNNYISGGGSVIAAGDALLGYEIEGLRYISPSKCDVDYLCGDLVGESPMVMHSLAHITSSDGFAELAKIREPYFNRTYEHFCSHLHSPYKTEYANYSAAVKKGNVVYVAHDIFSEYFEFGEAYVKNYFKRLLELTYTDGMAEIDGLMSSGRARLRVDRAKSKYLLHLLYAPVLKRGVSFVIDDIPPLSNIKVKLRLPEEIKNVSLQPEGIPLEFSKSGGEILFTLPKLKMHGIVVLEY